ncbi:hypothetical protein AB0C96_09140 [Streptomyces sp. NPDC048506]|uniref:hypothetical protein n=1 Tax=Streptomyces sp. NPDC048506 TaxID=3155028 RepID=UPI003440060C
MSNNRGPDSGDIRTTGTISAYLAGLNPTVRNISSAAVALARINELGWEPRGGYPGSDALWPVHCLVCGWEGTRFYSHLRRARPAIRHRGCVPQSEHPAALAKLAERAKNTCECREAHPTTPERIAEALDAIAQAQLRDDTGRLLTEIGRLLGPCPATGVRAAAVTVHLSARN